MKWDEWRERIGDSDDEEVDENIAFRAQDGDQPTVSLDTKGKLVYWGFSYGVCSPPCGNFQY